MGQTPAFSFTPDVSATVSPRVQGDTLYLSQEGGKATYQLLRDGFDVLPYSRIIVEDSATAVALELFDSVDTTLVFDIGTDGANGVLNASQENGIVSYSPGPAGLGSQSTYRALIISDPTSYFVSTFTGGSTFTYDTSKPPVYFPGSKKHLTWRPFDVIGGPQVPTATGIFDEPRVQLCINNDWISFISGFLTRGERDDVYDTSDENAQRVIQEMTRLQDALSNGDDNPCKLLEPSHEFDFAIGQQGWSLYGDGVYTPGLGFEAAFSSGYRLRIRYAGQTVAVSRVELDFDFESQGGLDLLKCNMQSKGIVIEYGQVDNANDQTRRFYLDDTGQNIVLEARAGNKSDPAVAGMVRFRRARFYGF